MKLSNPHWHMSEACIKQAKWKFWLPEPPVKSVTKFVEIPLEAIEGNTMKRSVDKCFHVADHHVHQRKPHGRLFGWRHFF
jgi:hypothetical protein